MLKLKHINVEDFNDDIFQDRFAYENSIYGGFNYNIHSEAVVVYHNDTSIHSLPTYINAWNSATYRITTGKTDASIEIINAPLPNNADQSVVYDSVIEISTMIIICISFVTLPVPYISFVVKEEEAGARHQQYISGLGALSYWLGNWFFDLIQYHIAIFTVLIFTAIFNVRVFIDHFFICYLTLLLYGMSTLPFLYSLSFCFSNPQTAQRVLRWFVLIIGPVLSASLVMPILAGVGKPGMQEIIYFCRIFPGFSLGESLIRIWVFKDKNPYLWENAGQNLFVLLVLIFVYWALLMGLEKMKASPSTRKYLWRTFVEPENIPYESVEYEDEDVILKRNQLQGNTERGHPIELHGLRKVYHPNKTAVHDLWFDVPDGQVFGFLGANGAGKSTTLNCLTGVFPMTEGKAYLNNFDVETEQSKLRRELGYCPQGDALFDRLTGREHLELYASIKGLSGEHRGDLDKLVNNMLKQLKLEKYADQTVGGYSGGNKRKLSTAIALLGSPSIVCLDEPSTGMDPEARRWMWNFISSTMAGRSVILTTHSMEEAEGLCDQIGIMCNGRLQCLGSAEHLKSKFAQGYHIDIKPKEEQNTRVKRFVEEHFPDSVLVEDHETNLKYQIPNEQAKLSELFARLEENLENSGISEYAIGSTTLEQVFMFLTASQQIDTEEENQV